MKQPHSPLAGRVFGSAAILVALYAILFSGMPNFSGEKAERILSDLAAHLSEESGQRGSEARLQYSAVEIRGLAYDKWAHISNLALDFIYQQWQDHSRFGLSTAGADLIPDHTNKMHVTMRFDEAINLISSSQLLAIVQPSKPILYAINRTPASSDGAIRHHLLIPASLGITMLEPRRDMQLEIINPVQVEASFFKVQHRVHAQLVSGIMRAFSQGAVWGVEKADLRYDSLQKSPKSIESKGTFTLDHLTFTRAGASTPPGTATAAWTMREQRNISGAVESMELDIEHGLFTDGDHKISIGGDLHFDIDDAPYGDIVVEISNPTEFVGSGWIAKDKQAFALALLDEIMGEEVGTHRQAIINIVRAKNGAWMVGKMPLDELLQKGFASMFIFNTEENHDQDSDKKTDPS